MYQLGSARHHAPKKYEKYVNESPPKTSAHGTLQSWTHLFSVVVITLKTA